ncbi:hypothetical protein JCM3765_000950 [Sporobolomyces pararoseus]
MVLATDQLRDQLVQFLASLPPDANPYLALSDRLRGLILPADDSHARNQLYALSAVFALIAILSILSLWIRWRKGILWFVRRSSTGLVRFHFSTSWAVPGLLFLVLLQPTMEYERELFRGKGRDDFMYWLTLPWLALAFSGIIACSAILSSHVAQLQARGQFATFRFSARVNSFGIILLVVYTLLFVPPAVVVGRLYSTLIKDLEETTEVLSTLATQWRGGLPDLLTALPALQRMGSAAIKYFEQLRILFSIFAASSLLLALIMSIASYFYLSLLRQEIKTIKTSFSSSQGLILRTTASHLKLERVWKTILFTVSVNIIIAILLAFNSLLIAVEPSKLAQRNHLRIALLLPLFSVGGFGLLSSAMLFYRALEAAPSDDKLRRAVREVGETVAGGSGSRKGGRRVAQESEEATMVGTIDSHKEDKGLKDASRRSSWFGGSSRRASVIPLQSKVLVEIEVVINEERTRTVPTPYPHPL